jgi:hypothetical protein
MIANQLPHEGGIGGEVVAGSSSEEPVIPTQRGAPEHSPAPPPIGGGQKPRSLPQPGQAGISHDPDDHR